MPYEPDKDERFYCGECRRKQDSMDGIKCLVCGKTTVSWFELKESEKDALRKWRKVNP